MGTNGGGRATGYRWVSRFQVGRRWFETREGSATWQPVDGPFKTKGGKRGSVHETVEAEAGGEEGGEGDCG
jgi:hypothetical protein